LPRFIEKNSIYFSVAGLEAGRLNHAGQRGVCNPLTGRARARLNRSPNEHARPREEVSAIDRPQPKTAERPEWVELTGSTVASIPEFS